MLYRKKLNMDEPSNVLDYIDSSTERVQKWLCNNRKVEQQSTKERNTPKKMLTVQLPIRLFNSFKQLLLLQEATRNRKFNKYMIQKQNKEYKFFRVLVLARGDQKAVCHFCDVCSE